MKIGILQVARVARHLTNETASERRQKERPGLLGRGIWPLLPSPRNVENIIFTYPSEKKVYDDDGESVV